MQFKIENEPLLMKIITSVLVVSDITAIYHLYNDIEMPEWILGLSMLHFFFLIYYRLKAEKLDRHIFTWTVAGGFLPIIPAFLLDKATEKTDARVSMLFNILTALGLLTIWIMKK